MSTAMQAGNVEGLPRPCMQQHHARETLMNSIHNKYMRRTRGHPAEQMLSITLPHIRFQGDQAHQQLPCMHEVSSAPPAAAAAALTAWIEAGLPGLSKPCCLLPQHLHNYDSAVHTQKRHSCGSSGTHHDLPALSSKAAATADCRTRADHIEALPGRSKPQNQMLCSAFKHKAPVLGRLRAAAVLAASFLPKCTKRIVVQRGRVLGCCCSADPKRAATAGPCLHHSASRATARWGCNKYKCSSGCSRSSSRGCCTLRLASSQQSCTTRHATQQHQQIPNPIVIQHTPD